MVIWAFFFFKCLIEQIPQGTGTVEMWAHVRVMWESLPQPPFQVPTGQPVLGTECPQKDRGGMVTLFIVLPLLVARIRERGLPPPLLLRHPAALGQPEASQLKVITTSPGTLPSDVQTVTHRPSRELFQNQNDTPLIFAYGFLPPGKDKPTNNAWTFVTSLEHNPKMWASPRFSPLPYEFYQLSSQNPWSHID